MAAREHRLVLTERKALEISGVASVDSFDNARIELDTDLGGLEISGQELKIGTLDLAEGRVTISGVIVAMSYGKRREEKSASYKGKSIISRLLK